MSKITPITQEELEAYNQDLGELNKKHNLSLGSEALITKDGKVASKVVVFRPEPVKTVPLPPEDKKTDEKTES